MSKRLVSRLLGMFQSRTQVGVDKAGNRYFTRVEEVDGAMKEKRWVEFKAADQDSTTIPVEWICWLNGQRKKAPTPEELAELEARRERVRQNIELLKKKEEEERKAGVRSVKKIGKADSPNLQSFVKQQFPGTPSDEHKGNIILFHYVLAGNISVDFGTHDDISVKHFQGPEEVSRPKDATDTDNAATDNERSSEPTGTGATFKPGTWQPPT
ncbi:hypothetical protein ACP70R_006123 [Stipagrostis hirtigluma subsp. patula]